MTSEIRANKQTNRVGLGTVEYTNTGIIVSGIVTCTELSGLTALNIAGVGTANTLDINGDIDVDGHTNLDNLSVAGVTTMSGNLTISNTDPRIIFVDTNNNPDFTLHANDGVMQVENSGSGTQVKLESSGSTRLFGNVIANKDLDVDGHTNLDNVSIAGVATATTFVGALTGTASGNPTLANGANDRIVTASGANALNGEANLTFDGTTLYTVGDYMVKDPSTASYITHTFASNFAKIDIRGTNIANSNHYLIGYGAGHSEANDLHIVNTVGDLILRTTQEKVRLTNGGDLLIADSTNSIYNDSSGGGINLKANGQIVNKKQASSTSDPLVWLNDTGQTTNRTIVLAQDGTERGYLGLTGTSLSLGVNGGDRVLIHSNGKISTGVNNNSYELTIGGLSGGPTLWLRDSTTSGSPRILFGSTSAALIGGITYNNSSNHMEFATNGGERLRIDSSGNITAVNTASGGQSVTLSVGASNASGVNDGIIKIINGGTGNGVIQWDYEGNANRAQIYVYRSDQALTFTTAGSERFRIFNTNTLGIARFTSPASGDTLNLQTDAGGGQGMIFGTDTSNSHIYLKNNSSGHFGFQYKHGSTTQLEVKSNGAIQQYASGGENQFISKRTGSTYSNGDYYFYLFAKNNGDTNVGSMGIVRDTANDDSRIVFSTATGGTNTERLRITSTGNTRIGIPPNNGSSSLIDEKQATIGTKHFYTVYHNFSSTNSPLAVNSKIPTNSCGTVEIMAGWANGNGITYKKFCWASSGNVSGCTQVYATGASRYGVSTSVGTPTMSISGDYVNFSFTFSDSQGNKMEKLKIHFEYFNQFRTDG